MRKSFLGYYLDRIEKGIGIQPSPTTEMAALPAVFKTDSGEEVSEEARKTPVFIDEADLEFLKQFPPSLWKQALAWRYGSLLEAAWDAKERGKKFPEIQNVTLYYRRGKKGKAPVVFPKVQTGASALLHKITADVDDVMLSQLTPRQKQKYIDHAKNNKLGSLGYVLSGIKKGKGLAASKGYMFPGENDMRKRLGSLYKAHEEGWYGKFPEEQMKLLNFGGGGKVKVPVYSPQELAKMQGTGERYDIAEDGKRIWYAFNKDTGEPIEISEYLPKLNPAVMVSTKAVHKFKRRMEWHRQLSKDFESGDIEDYRKVFENPGRLDKKIEELKEFLEKNPRPARGADPMRGQRNQVKDRLRKLSNIQRIVTYLQQRVCKTENCEELKDVNSFYQHLHGIIDSLKSEAEHIRDQSPRYDVHDWNISHWNPRYDNPHTSWTGFGTWNPNWQQPRRVHGGLQQLGLDPQEVWDSVKEYLVQAGSRPSSRGHTAEIPYTKSWDNKKQIDMGTLAKGINAYLSRGDIYNTPAWFAMIKNWWAIFENASDYLRRQIGSGHFLDYARYMKAKREGAKLDIDLKQARQNMARFAYQAGYNYAGMIHQLKSRMGGLMGGIDLESIFGDPGIQSDLQAAAGSIVSRWNRSKRPADPRLQRSKDHGRTSHAISLIHELIDDEQVGAAVDRAVSKESGTTATAVGQLGADSSAKERKLTKQIIDTGLAFMIYRHIFIYQKNQSGEAWNIRDANAFASRAVDNWLQKRGVRPFGGQIDVSKGDPDKGTGAYALAKRQTEEEEQFRQQMSDLGYQGELTAKMQSPESKDSPGVEEDHHNQAQQLMTMVKLIDNIHVMKQLHPESPKYNPKIRAFYDKMVQNRRLGWPIIKVLLRRVDSMKLDQLTTKKKDQLRRSER